jgi:hypothetical protein
MQLYDCICYLKPLLLNRQAKYSVTGSCYREVKQVVEPTAHREGIYMATALAQVYALPRCSVCRRLFTHPAILGLSCWEGNRRANATWERACSCPPYCMQTWQDDASTCLAASAVWTRTSSAATLRRRQWASHSF